MLEDEYRAREQELLQALDELTAFLRRFGDDRWSARFDRWRADLKGCVDRRASKGAKQQIVSEMQRMYGGGMGSFTDFIICPDNGHIIAADDVATVNRQLMHLGDKVFRLSEIYQKPGYKNFD